MAYGNGYQSANGNEAASEKWRNVNENLAIISKWQLKYNINM
jgi:hypothetical protein